MILKFELKNTSFRGENRGNTPNNTAYNFTYFRFKLYYVCWRLKDGNWRRSQNELKEEIKTETVEVIETEDFKNYEFLDVVLEEEQENMKKDNAK